MAVSAFQKVVNKLFDQFIKQWGREPQTPKEWMDLQNEAVQYFNRTKGAPLKPKAPPFQGWNPTVIPGGKGIKSLLKSGDVKKGVAPKTKLSTLEGKKQKLDKAINKEEWIAKKQRENKEAVERFKEKTKKKTVEDFRDDGDFDPGGMASGGRIGYAAGKIVKGGKWVIKNLEQALKEINAGTYQKGLGPMEKEAFKWEIKGLIGRIRMGEPIPEDMIKTMRQDPRFKDIVKIRSTDPDLYEMEDVILNYGKKGDVVDEQVDILEKFTPTGKGNAEGGRIGLMYGGDPGFQFEYGGSWADWRDQHQHQMPVTDYIKTRLPKERLPFRDMQEGGLAYMLGEPTYMKYSIGGSVGHAPWLKPTGRPQPQGQNETPTPHVAGTPNPLKAPRGLPSVAPKNMDPAYMQQQMMQQAMMGRGQGIPGQGPRTMANEGGIMRMGFKKGGDMSRRGFLKLMAGLAALPVFGKFFKAAKLAKPAAAVTETIVQSNAPGMPAWFPSLVRRVIKEGEDVSKSAGAMERQTVHRATLPSGTPVEVTQDLVTKDVIVDIGEQTKHGWSSGRYGQPTRLELKKGEWIEPTKTKKGIKTKDEFIVEEAEFTGGHPENVKFEETVDFRYGDHGSDFSEVERYAIGKNKDKKIIGKQADKDAWAEGRAESAADEIDDFASGGLAHLLGE